VAVQMVQVGPVVTLSLHIVQYDEFVHVEQLDMAEEQARQLDPLM
jgi:hypothetical protein